MEPRKKKYSIDEVSSIYHSTIIEIHKKFTVPGKRISSIARKHLLEEGVIPLKEYVQEVFESDKIHQVFDFSKYEFSDVKDQGKIDEAVQKLASVYTSIKDTVALGDEDNALSLLKEFREFCNNLLKE